MPPKKIIKKNKAKSGPKKEKLFSSQAGIKKEARLPAETVAPITEPLAPPRGMHDLLPSEEPYEELILETAKALARNFGYGKITTPILEHLSLFEHSVGEVTDIVQKEMYHFVDQGGEHLALRPEGTASVARAYLNHGMVNLPQPVKLWYGGPFFRRERPQAGRYRQFRQWSLEALGDAHPIVDAEIISLAYRLCRELQLAIKVQINSLGCAACRGSYKEMLLDYYRIRKGLICETCKERLERNPLRLLDCKEPGCVLIKEGAPQLMDYLDEACRDHFMRVLEYLDELEIPYTLDTYLVRGLDYYTRTVFELIAEPVAVKPAASSEASGVAADSGKTAAAPLALGGGGRYDALLEQLGGRPTPACGVSLGVERLILLLKAQQPELLHPPAQIFVAQLGESARRRALTLLHQLHKVLPVAAALSKDGLKSQLEIANRLGVRFAVIIGQKEILDGTAIVRDMEAGIQEVVDYNKLINELKKKLGLTVS